MSQLKAEASFVQKAIELVRLSGRLTIAQQFTAGMERRKLKVREADG
jgi:hypothetical protein